LAGVLLLVAWFRPGARGIALILGVVALVSFGVSAWMTSESQPWAFYFSPLRAWEFAVGGLVSLVVAERWASAFRFSPVMGWTGIALIAVAYLSVSETDPFPASSRCCRSRARRCCCCQAPQECRRAGKLLSLPPFQWTGKLSYSLYLWHWPVIVYATILWPDLTLAAGLPAWR
jgi:peptidoglycan/LPS O-acetylase OafA/YrhL